ncbi:MAG: YifB family Mg chelatase-like AAA ATPase [Spirochaetales bacterium]|nr:YifB family Mg chelatase-like AAA ATPase [Spirochaetales bacterium]
MVGKAFTWTRMGLSCSLVETEVDIKKGLPSILVTGLLSQEVKEARERIRPAIQNSGIDFPLKRITINLSPAEMVKNGSHYDLAIAMAMLEAMEVVTELDNYAFFGELNLSGEIKWIRGLFPMVLEALKGKFRYIFIPADNFAEFMQLRTDRIIPVHNLRQVIDIINSGDFTVPEDEYMINKSNIITKIPDFSDIMGQPELVDAMLVAACGFHHAIIVGPPGAGKTMGASRLPGILPDLSEEERFEINKIYSVAGVHYFDQYSGARPFRCPHNTFSSRAVIGGGPKIMPGEVSLAHKGVLFLDEFLEFHSDTLQSLRTIIENKAVYISMSSGCASYPADFLLIAACNPCPCGQFGSRSGNCVCNEKEVRRYRRKLNNPLVDRIDLQIKVDRLNYQELVHGEHAANSADLRQIVLRVRDMQSRRFANETFKLNSLIPPGKISYYCTMEKGGNAILEEYMDSNLLTARSCHKILRIARTIADIGEHDIIRLTDLQRAIEYRFLDKEIM